MSLRHAPRSLPITPWLLFVSSAGYGAAKLALESTATLNLLALHFVGAMLALVPFVIIVKPNWPDRLAVIDQVIVTLLSQLGHFLCIYPYLS